MTVPLDLIKAKGVAYEVSGKYFMAATNGRFLHIIPKLTWNDSATKSKKKKEKASKQTNKTQLLPLSSTDLMFA